MTTEEVRVRLRTKLESAFGAEEASMLMDRPPGGWNDLVTNQVLEARLDAMKYELIATMEKGFRNQTWRLLGAIFVAFGVFATLTRVT
jgi:hypothetical protein